MRHIANDIKIELELIQPNINESFVVRHYNKDEQSDQRYPWHYHAEIEIMYINSGSGTRFIGNNMSLFKNGDLVIIGPYLPHSGSVDRYTNNIGQTLIYFTKDLFSSEFYNLPETRHLKELIQLSHQGIAIRGDEKQIIGRKITELYELKGIEKLLSLIEILNDIHQCDNKILLNKPSKKNAYPKVSKEARISRIYNYIQENYTESISIADVSNIVGMTDSAFCRYFKKYSGQTFTNYLKEYRVMNANRLIRESDYSISDIAYKSGFNNLSYFHRTFKESVGRSPLAQKRILRKSD